MRPRDLLFPLVMCLLTLATVYRYGAVRRFIDESREYTFVLAADEGSISRIKADLRGATFQRVDEESVEDGVYRITVRCPPDKLGRMWLLLGRMSDEEVQD